MMGNGKLFTVIVLCGVCTFLLRAFPFLLFGGNRKMPVQVKYLGNALPAAIMAALLIYCMKDVTIQSIRQSIPLLVSVTLVAVTYCMKKNTFLSVVIGTVLYMVLKHHF